ncbi:MAG: pyridoxamine 5'-phosphate oxidase family protein [Chitinophagaceae bacterium]|nr:pyridoxamine 5'-phosphate oxidase family protein [Chitinophagaceae bacterium]
MFGQLTREQIEEVLTKQLVGRIGCHADNITYVVPTSYAYHDNTIYCHTYEGMKLNMMKQNPQVCFEVDVLENLSDWKSVIAWGKFEEITKEADRKDALQILLNRSLPFITSKTMQFGDDWPFTASTTENINGVLFKIQLKNKTGRYEMGDAVRNERH